MSMKRKREMEPVERGSLEELLGWMEEDLPQDELGRARAMYTGDGERRVADEEEAEVETLGWRENLAMRLWDARGSLPKNVVLQAIAVLVGQRELWGEWREEEATLRSVELARRPVREYVQRVIARRDATDVEIVDWEERYSFGVAEQSMSYSGVVGGKSHDSRMRLWFEPALNKQPGDRYYQTGKVKSLHAYFCLLPEKELSPSELAALVGKEIVEAFGVQVAESGVEFVRGLEELLKTDPQARVNGGGLVMSEQKVFRLVHGLVWPLTKSRQGDMRTLVVGVLCQGPNKQGRDRENRELLRNHGGKIRLDLLRQRPKGAEGRWRSKCLVNVAELNDRGKDLSFMWGRTVQSVEAGVEGYVGAGSVSLVVENRRRIVNRVVAERGVGDTKVADRELFEDAVWEMGKMSEDERVGRMAVMCLSESRGWYLGIGVDHDDRVVMGVFTLGDEVPRGDLGVGWFEMGVGGKWELDEWVRKEKL